MKQRSEISSQDKWNVEALFPHLELWYQAYESFDFRALQTFQGRLAENVLVLKQLLETLFALSRQLEKLYTYVHLRHDEDLKHDAHKQAYEKVTMVACEFQQACAWIEPEILALSDATMNAYLQHPSLATYRFYLEKIIRLKPHTLSKEEEKLLAMVTQPLQTTSKAFGALNNADLKFAKVKDKEGKSHELSHGLYHLYLRSEDRTLRQHAFMTLHGAFENVENTLAELLYGQVQNHVFQARARRYNSSLQAALYPKNIPLSVYQNLIYAVRSHLPSLHRYMKLRKKALKLEELHAYDLYVPLLEQEQRQLTYEESEQLVIDSVAPLGTAYQAAVKKGLQDEKWVDRFENQNKRSGAYSSGCFDSYPYILLNYKGILKDTFTLAHEAGHSMHSFLSHHTQPYHDSHYPIFVAEVASTFNEELLMHLLLLKQQIKKNALILLMRKLRTSEPLSFAKLCLLNLNLLFTNKLKKELPLPLRFLRICIYNLTEIILAPM